MPGYDHLYGSTQTSGGTGTSSGAVGGYTPPSPPKQKGPDLRTRARGGIISLWQR